MVIVKLRMLRSHLGLLSCLRDFLRYFAGYLINTRLKRICLIVIVTSLLWWWLGTSSSQTGRFVPWTQRALRRRPTSTKYFVPVRDNDMYMYSAIANSYLPVTGSINIIITTLDASRSSLECCVLLENNTVFITRPREYFFYHTIDVTFIAKIYEYFQPKLYKAHQYSCVVPEIGHHPSHVTLTSSVCSPDIRDYLPVLYPQQVPGGLAVCGKVAYSGGLDPEKVIEWFEVQRILGVDKVLIFDLGNPESLTRVFKYYQDIGLLDLQPYELPGEPANRTMAGLDQSKAQFHHDESMAVLECRQRMSGYTYVMSHDLDEMIIPRKDMGLKQFFQEMMQTYQDSAGFYFETEFFIYNWGPTNPEEDLAFTRYRKATRPHRECTKFVFLPHRTLSVITHSIFPLSQYTVYRLGPDEAILHHYRKCPENVWSTCFPETIVDDVMTRYQDLHERVVKVRQATNTRQTWTSETYHS